MGAACHAMHAVVQARSFMHRYRVGQIGQRELTAITSSSPTHPEQPRADCARDILKPARMPLVRNARTKASEARGACALSPV